MEQTSSSVWPIKVRWRKWVASCNKDTGLWQLKVVSPPSAMFHATRWWTKLLFWREISYCVGEWCPALLGFTPKTGHWVPCWMNSSRMKLKIRIWNSVSKAVIGYLNITIQLSILTVIISKVEYLKAITAYLKSEIKLWFSKLHIWISQLKFRFLCESKLNWIMEFQNCILEYHDWIFNAKTAYLNIIIELWILMGITRALHKNLRNRYLILSMLWLLESASFSETVHVPKNERKCQVLPV